MFLHNLKIAWRNLLKYKLQTSISILSLTVGMVCFALSALWLRYENSYDAWWPKHDDVYLLQYSNGGGYYQEHGFSNYSPYDCGKRLAENNPQIELAAKLATNGGNVSLDPESEDNVQGKMLTIDDKGQQLMDIKVMEGPKELKLSHEEIALTPSVAAHLFPNGDAIGKKVYAGYQGWLTVKAIVEDAPKPTLFPYDFIMGFNDFQEFYMAGPSGARECLTFVRVAAEDKSTLEKSLEKEVINDEGGTWVDEETGEVFVFEPMTFEHFYRLLPLSEMREKTDMVEKVVQQNHLRLFVVLGIIVICCALFNYFTVLVTRIRIRQRELALRYVHGASMGSLILLVATELVLILSMATSLATCMVSFTLDDFKAVCCIHESQSFFIGWFLIFALAAALVSLSVTTVIVYVCNRRQLRQALGKYKQQPQDRRLLGGIRGGLMVTQLAVSIGAVFCSLVMMHQINHLFTSPDMGFAKHNRGCVNFIRNGEDGKGMYYAAIAEKELKECPEIEEVLVGYDYPIPNGFQNPYGDGDQNTFTFKTEGTDGEGIPFLQVAADEHYFHFMDLQLLDGEFISSKDDPMLVCITESAAKALGEQGKVGGEFKVGDSDKKYVVKGIVKDLSYQSPTTPTSPIVFNHYINNVAHLNNIVLPIRWKEGTDVETLKHRLDERLRKVLKIWGVSIAEEEYDKFLQSERALCRLLMLVTAVCVLIAIFGIFGMVSLACERRRKEIAIRKVHGAHTGTIIRMFLREHVYLLLASAAIAFPIGYYLMHQWLSQYAKQAPVYWWIYPAILLAMLVLIFLTVIWQIRKAARENPADVVKSE